MSERFIFISSIGFCIFIGWLVYNYLPKFTKNLKSLTYLASFVLIIILCLYSVKTINRNKAWKDNFTLFETDVKTSKNSAKGHYMAGYALLRKVVFPSNEEEVQKRDNFCEESLLHFNNALKLYPKYTDAMSELGGLYFDCYKDVAKSLHYYAMALKRNSIRHNAMRRSITIILNNTDALLTENQVPSTPSEIIQSCDELLEIIPDLGEAYYVKGVIYDKYLNEKELSLINFEKANLYMKKGE